MSLRLLILLLPLLFAGCLAAEGVYHPVKEGETLYRISRVYGVDELYLARINGIPSPKGLRAGTSIYIPGASKVKDVGKASSSPSSRSKSSATAKRKSPASASRKSSSVPMASTTVPSGSSPRFAWPLRGALLRSYGAESKGVEIAASVSSAVQASAAGRVIYSGDGIRSYGNLIIVKHSGDYFTVYGYNQKNLVTTGSFVSQGEKIALSGTPPGGGSTRLYFEIRRGKDAVDPRKYLP
ncbi:MAG: hypothetical protein C0621_08720 [Desulfuromonas sp.]|nr:MAG: hypothetical protein C0621_08720 [Desulfuromonas sp.]